MDALALRPEEGEAFHRRGAGIAEPVRQARVELGRLTPAEDEVALAEDQPELAAEDIEPLVALVGLGVRLPLRRARRQDHLEGLQWAGLLAQRDDRHAVQRPRREVHPGVTHRRRPDEFVEGHPVRAGERQQQFQARAPVPGFQP